AVGQRWWITAVAVRQQQQQQSPPAIYSVVLWPTDFGYALLQCGHLPPTDGLLLQQRLHLLAVAGERQPPTEHQPDELFKGTRTAGNKLHWIRSSTWRSSGRWRLPRKQRQFAHNNHWWRK